MNCFPSWIKNLTTINSKEGLMKFIKGFLMLLVLGTMVFVLQAMSYESDIFLQEEALWCKDGGCENTNPDNPSRCTSPASYLAKNICNAIGADCKTCVDMTLSDCICYEGSDFCMKADESYYYGTEVECNISK